MYLFFMTIKFSTENTKLENIFRQSIVNDDKQKKKKTPERNKQAKNTLFICNDQHSVK